ncbi:peptidylprolyl isomerase [Sphingomonas psychrotolerans]|uniref:peptidylprolyl isomerase n=1 Tax=Sphingomonas psychrotolerans TaxID=1327635 RepID=A0A2K8MHX6_9SPHN|nr:peptidylprolyl isomerase [Sphingomonas psychrotolerans]ATY30771.1 peptidylprolyl isomerase [Sphingomonas psychrotolerans]
MWMRWVAAFLLTLLALPAFAQTPVAAPANPRVAVETTAGRFVVEVYADKAPISARNFLRYVDQKRLDGISFYRTVKVQDRFGFVQFGVQNAPAKMLAPIKHEPTSQTGIKHLDGTLSMPRLAPGSARGEFTIMLGDQPSFDADPAKAGDNLGYAAFARVIEGMDVVLKIFDAPTSPTKTLQGSFKGEIPETPVKVLTARRVTG